MNRLIYFHLSSVMMLSGNAGAPTIAWRDLRWPLQDTPNSKFSVWNPTGLLKMISWNTSPILPVCHKRRVRARNGAFMKNVWPCVRASGIQTCSYRHAEVNGAHGAEEVRNESREQRGGLYIKHWFWLWSLIFNCSQKQTRMRWNLEPVTPERGRQKTPSW